MNLLENVIGAAQIASLLFLSPLLRSRYNRWGASEAEIQETLPGDELVPDPMLGYTHAISIAAPPSAIWPWLVQIGQGRGGLYSYDGLENLAGCKIHSVDMILPEHQNPNPGDLVRLGPQGYPCFSIAAIEQGKALVLVSADPKTGEPATGNPRIEKGYSIASWQFALEPEDAQNTRLLVRQRLAYSPDLAWVWRLTEPINFVMERKMLLGIKQRVEKNQ